ncbi:MAG: WD40/YVTN/BNR-like repeat-containing protein [Hyphomicrobiales bacterium]
MKKVAVVAGTKKGVFVLESNADRKEWKLRGPFVGGIDVNHAIIDERNGRLYATDNNPWFGPQITYSDDLGETWKTATANPRFAGDPEASESNPWFFSETKVMDRFWRIQPGLEPNTVYCGVAPGAVFASNDGGTTWSENKALSQVPTRSTWQPSNGGLALHSVVMDPTRPGRMWIAVSAGGVYRTDDGGETWEPKNRGIRDMGATFDPNLPLYPETGQCVHQLVRAAGDGDRLYLQTHLGTYRTEDGGDSWIDITQGLPSEFGLAMTVHPHDPDTAYVAPIVGGEFRVPPDFSLRVYRTRDAGKTWQAFGAGLPTGDAYMTVYRNGLGHDDMDPAGIYVGTNTGQLYASIDEGETWTLVTPNLPPITSVQAHVLE